MAPVTTDNTKVDEAVGNLAIDLSNLDATWWNNVTSNGSDIRVTDDTGTKFGSETAYSMELENFDKNNQTGWLFIDSSGHLATSVDKTFRVYVGDTSLSLPAPSDTLGAENVWPSRYGYRSDLDGGASDSTSNNRDATANGDLPTDVSGQIGDAQSFDGNGDYFSVPDADYVGANGYSLQIWVKNPDSSGNDRGLIGRDDAGSNRFWQFRVNDDNDEGGTIQFIPFNSSGSPIANFQSNTSVTDGNWHKVTVVYDNSNGSSIYIDGQLDASDSTTGTHKDGTGANPLIGARGDLDDYQNGDLDEARIVTEPITANQETTEYNNQSNNASFFTFGATETPPTDVTVNASTVILSTTAVAESVTTEEDVTYFASSVTLNASPVDETVTTYKEISGNVTLSGNNVQDAVMTLINSDNDTVVATTTTDANGNYSFQGETGKTYHVTVEYDDGNNKYNAKSKPYLNP